MRRLELDRLSGRHVILEPLHVSHVDELAAATGGDRSSFAYTRVPDGLDDTADYVEWLLRDAADGAVGPFVQRRLSDGRLVGCTRYLHPAWPLDRDVPDEVEIGGTWLCADAQRSAINTEAKLLLLTHAFERWDVQRVAVCTDARNLRSRAAIERLGVAFEGVLRRHRASSLAGDGGHLRDSAMYAVTVDDWPTVRERLVGLLHR
jgi:RimJ/RimL family protein N-acetyltransferase